MRVGCLEKQEMENRNRTENGKRKSKVINYAHAHKSLVPAHVIMKAALGNSRQVTDG